jgi:hypothetical protein
LIPAQATGRLSSLDSAALLTIEKLNRIDQAHTRRGWLVLPDSIGQELSYAPFPAELPLLDSVPKLIVVSRRIQAFGAYENGRLVRWGPTSTGKKETPTDPGLFFTNWKARTAISTDDSTWVLNWYFNFVSTKGIAFHEYSLPGRPASHGCVRLLQADAEWIFDWADQWALGRRPGIHPKRYGTPVLVAGDYDYARRPPWFSLPEDPVAGHVSSEELTSQLLPYLATIAARADRSPPAYAVSEASDAPRTDLSSSNSARQCGQAMTWSSISSLWSSEPERSSSDCIDSGERQFDRSSPLTRVASNRS